MWASEMEVALTSRMNRVLTTVSAIQQRQEYEISTIARHTARIKQLEDEKADLLKAVGTIDRCIQLVSANGIGKIEGMVSDGLRRVFGEGIGLVIEKKETARGITYRILVRDGETIGDPMRFFGGGIQNVVAFLLRVILIKRFKLAPFLALDEQFSNVSPEYQPRVAQLLKTLSGLGFTIFAVSQQPAITAGADTVYKLTIHCPSCNYDVTPRSYTDEQGEVKYGITANPCPGCQTAFPNALPRLQKA